MCRISDWISAKKESSLSSLSGLITANLKPLFGGGNCGRAYPVEQVVQQGLKQVQSLTACLGLDIGKQMTADCHLVSAAKAVPAPSCLIFPQSR